MNGTWGVGEVVATSATATQLDNATLPSPSATAVTQVWPHFQLFPGWQSWQIDENTTFTLPIDMRFNDGHRVSIVAYSILMLLSAVGNFTVLSILVRRRRGARSTNINTMLIHLAIADLLVTFLLMPCEIAWSATVMWWAGDAWCRIMAFFRTFGLFQSSFVLVCISIDRYFAVLKPMNLSNDRRGKIMLSCAWIGSVLCSLPQMLVFRVQAHPFVPWFEQCITIWFAQDAKTPSTQEFMYFVFGMLMMYCLPFFVILFCYASILGEIYRRSREAKGDRFRRSSLGFLGKAKGRTLKMTVIIVVVFFICWTPYYFMSLWHFFDHKGSQKVDQKLQKGLYIFACTNSCMNPIVYGAFNIRPRRTDRRGVGGGAGGVGGQQTQLMSTGPGGEVVRLVSWKRSASTPSPSAAAAMAAARNGDCCHHSCRRTVVIAKQRRHKVNFT